MNDVQRFILTEAEKAGVGIQKNFAKELEKQIPILLSSNDSIRNEAITLIYESIVTLQDQRLIEASVSGMYNTQEAWYSRVPTVFKLTEKGSQFLINHRLSEANIKLTENTIRNFKFQVKNSLLSFGLACISTIFIVITTISQCNSNEEKHIETISKELKELNIRMDSLNSHLSKFDSLNSKEVLKGTNKKK